MGATDGEPRRDARSDENDNPFIAFRRFADEQMSSLLRGIIGLPSAFTSNSSDSRWSPYDEGERRHPSDCWTSSLQHSQEWDRQTPQKPAPADGAVEKPLVGYGERLEGDARETGVPRPLYQSLTGDGPKRSSSFASRDVNRDEVLRCPYRPVQQDAPLQNSGSAPQPPAPCPGLFIFGEDLPLSRGLFPRHLNESILLGALGVWPITYVAMSPYSPLRLEQQESFRDHGAKWRNAFEDLLVVQSGREMAEEKQRSQYQGSSSEWIGSMLERGLFGSFKQIGAGDERLTESSPLANEVDPRLPEYDAQGDEVTELDVYERFLGIQGQLPTSSLPFATQPSKSNAECAREDDQIGIISTLTKTEQKVLPNGTVHTKVMLKKRFADGREESSETLHTTQISSAQKVHLPMTAQSAERAVVKAAAVGNKTQEKKNRGWFWS